MGEYNLETKYKPNAASLMYALNEPTLQYNPSSDASVVQTSQREEPKWSSTPEGKGTLEGAKVGMQSGNLVNTLTSAGIGNMVNAGTVTGMGAGLTGAGLVLGAMDQNAQIDYANKKLVADQQSAANSANVAGLYKMMGNNFSTVG